MRAPEFWHERGPISDSLIPLSWVWQAGAWLKQATTTPSHPGIPVICIGNLIAGGAGKTPIAIAIAEMLREIGVAPAFLSRGHGGHIRGPYQVDPDTDDARNVGDEPLLLAQNAPAWIARQRGLGAEAAKQSGAHALVLDDGFQNPTLRKDMSFIVVDGGYGFGNGRVMPAGPLREPLNAGLDRATALICVGEDRVGLRSDYGDRLPVFQARLLPYSAAATSLSRTRVLAFAGIGRPQKFYETLRGVGADIVETQDFDDHQPFTATAWQDLKRRAQQHQLRLVTTEKDWMRLKSFADPAEVTVLPVRAVFDDARPLLELLDQVCTEYAHAL